jgi:anti-sigma B factor antagonist
MDDDGQLTIAIERSAMRVMVHVSGALDASSTPTLEQELAAVLRDASGDVIIDLVNVNFVGSCGLTALVRARDRLAATGRSLTITRPSTAVVRALPVLAAAGVSDLDDLVATP